MFSRLIFYAGCILCILGWERKKDCCGKSKKLNRWSTGHGITKGNKPMLFCMSSVEPTG